MPTDWTCLIYMAGDNDLRTGVDQDLAEIATADSDSVRVAVQVDEPLKDTLRLGLRGHRLIVNDQLMNVNSGVPDVLTSFLRWGEQNFTAKCYAVILWSHGAGFINFTAEQLGKIETDRQTAKRLFEARSSFHTTTIEAFVTASAINLDLTAKDFLDNRETRDALLNARPNGKKFAIVGCDACHMNMVEVAHELRDCASILVASEEKEEPDGWPYGQILNSLRNGVSPEDAARAMVEAYDRATAANPKATLSAVRLEQMDALAGDLNALGAALQPLLSQKLESIAIARATARAFTFTDYVDLGGFARALTETVGQQSAAIQAATSVINRIENAVIARTCDPAVSGAYGIAVYLPNGPVNDEYADLSLVLAAPRWAKFVAEYGKVRGTLPTCDPTSLPSAGAPSPAAPAELVAAT